MKGRVVWRIVAGVLSMGFLVYGFGMVGRV